MSAETDESGRRRVRPKKRGGGSRERPDFVMGQCGKSDTVACSDERIEESIVFALFIQFHDAMDQATAPDGRAMVAWWNLGPYTLRVKREIVSDGAANHSPDKVFEIPATSDKAPFYKDGLIYEPVLVSPGSERPTVGAKITLVDPPDGFAGVTELSVTWPVRGASSLCACCLRSYPT